MPFAAFLLAGCATIPTSGGIHDGRPGAFDAADSTVRVLPPPPRPGATVQDIVRGFLLASPTFEDGHRIAEATRLLGVALQRLEGGEARGTVTDRTGGRRVSWSLLRPMPMRRAAE